jgi:three-Cys-motif partner protein
MTQDFFDEMTEQSEIKVQIVHKYFSAWSKVMISLVKRKPKPQIAYVDLYCGPGKYNDGTKSTPILILEDAVNNKQLSESLRAFFNDKDNAKALEEEIKKIPDIDNLKYRPVVKDYTVDDTLVEKFKNWSLPTLFFLDPWGYNGISNKLIQAILKPFGCDCFFFFNYKRINAALSNSQLEKNMNALFSKTRADDLRKRLLPLKHPIERQEVIITGLKDALKDIGGTYSHEFCMKDDSGKRTSHFLIGVSKSEKAYDIMKSIMATRSSNRDQGIPSFTFSPVSDRNSFLPGLSPFDQLKDELLAEFGGRTLSMIDVFKEHNVGTPYVASNYKTALNELEVQGLITADPPAEQRRLQNGLRTFGDNVIITFPQKR